MLTGKKIIVAVTGSIAAYKTAYLIRLLVQEHAEVKVVMTYASKDFITPLTLSTLSKNPVLCEPFEPQSGAWNSHVELGLWADMMLVAPVTANTLAKMSNGIADNYLLTVYLSARCPIVFAPAMDLDMYNHPLTKSNILKLQSLGHTLIEPQTGELASGLSGAGRMEEPENILNFVIGHFKRKNDLKGKKVLISAGPTHEAIDPVRYIGNHSSGKMGFALAQAAAARGAEVVLISGPTNMSVKHLSIHRVDVISAQQMYDACLKHFNKCDITIMAAAVADFTPEKPANQKIKKKDSLLEIKLKPTKDILAEMGATKKTDQILVGFALETDQELVNARNKLDNKKLDLIVLNSLKDVGAGFDKPTNKITILDKEGTSTEYDLKVKQEVAEDILDKVVELVIRTK